MPKKQVTYSQRPTRATVRAHAKGDRQFRTYDTSYIRPKKNHVPMVAALIAALVVIALIALVVVPALRGPAKELVAEGTQVSIVVEDGATTSDIARTLSEKAIIAESSQFVEAVKTRGVDGQLKPGAYTVVGGTSLDDLVSQFLAGPPALSFTVPEGFTVSRIARVVEEAYKGRITAEQFMAEANNAAAYAADVPFVADAYNNSLEGFLFPKTYPMDERDTASSVVRKMLSQYQTEVASLDYSYAANAGLSVYDALILASVVEREAAEDNAPRVASVFYNRLVGGMPLQSDATVAYFVDRDPTPEDLDIESPYNTYLNYGLPAGPICSPGLACLQAVCAPETTNYLYFYFAPDSSGNMVYTFSETYDEHQMAIAVSEGWVEDPAAAGQEAAQEPEAGQPEAGAQQAAQPEAGAQQAAA